MKKVFKVLNILLCCLLAVLLAVNLYTLIARYVSKDELPLLFGYTTAVVSSGSMEPTINTYDLVVIAAKKSYEVGDIVTFSKGGSYTTHRIISRTENGFITQGDYEGNSPDGEIAVTQIKGKVVATIPKVGYVVEFMRTPFGLLLLTVVGLTLLLLPNILSGARRQKDATVNVAPQPRASIINRKAK